MRRSFGFDLLLLSITIAFIESNIIISVAECGKHNKAVDRLGYHAAFCSSARTYIHDASVSELRDCLSGAGVSPMTQLMCHPYT